MVIIITTIQLYQQTSFPLNDDDHGELYMLKIRNYFNNDVMLKWFWSTISHWFVAI